MSESERPVGELASLLGEPQPKASNHLACLRWCGFVMTRREHRTLHDRLANGRVVAIVELARNCCTRMPSTWLRVVAWPTNFPLALG